MPSYTKPQLREIYDRTGGECHIYHKKLAFTNHGDHREKGAWEVDHSVPKAKGGTDHGNNLVPACTTCNRSKQDRATRTARAWSGETKRPPSREKRREDQRFWNTVKVIGVGLGALALWLCSTKKDDSLPPNP